MPPGLRWDVSCGSEFTRSREKVKEKQAKCLTFGVGGEGHAFPPGERHRSIPSWGFNPSNSGGQERGLPELRNGGVGVSSDLH